MALYRQPRLQTLLLPVVFLAFAAAAVFLVVITVRGDGPPVWFAVVWLAALAWNAYWFLFRICTEVEVEGGTLRWRTPLRRGSAPVSAVRAVRPFPLSSQLAVIEVDDAPKLYVMARYGLAPLAIALRDAAPHAEIHGL